MTSTDRAAPSAARPPRQVVATVAANRRVGAYHHLILHGPDMVAGTRAGQFVALAVGGPTSATLLRRAFSVHRVVTGKDGDPDRLEVVVAAHGPGTRWLTEQPVGAPVDVVGPLGRPFPLPTEPVACVLVGGGYGSAPLFWLSELLRDRGCHVELVLGAASRDRLFGLELGPKVADATVVTTDDGSLGAEGMVTDVLSEVITGCSAAVVYGCGPMPMLREISRIAAEHGAIAQVAVEEAMACGIGVCMTCVMPVRGRDGQTAMRRACLEGPTFRGDRVRWEAFDQGWGRVPADCLGAPSGAGA